MRHDEVDGELRPLARALDALGEGESHRPGLEERVLRASRGALGRRGGAEVVVLARVGMARSMVRIAAAVALLACAGVVAWSLRGGANTPQPGAIVAQGPVSAAPAVATTASIQDDELTMIALSSWDDSTRAEIDSLYSEAHDLDASLSKAFAPGLGLLEGGAM